MGPARAAALEKAKMQLQKTLAMSTRDVSELFSSWDTNGDGHIDAKEFRKAVRALGYEVPREVSDAVFADYDVDGSGTVEYTEFVRYSLRDVLRRENMRVMDTFRAWDADGSGTVDKTEFRDAIASLGFDIPRAELDGFFNEIDSSGDGQIDFKELNAVLRHGSSMRLGGEIKTRSSNSVPLRATADQPGQRKPSPPPRRASSPSQRRPSSPAAPRRASSPAQQQRRPSPPPRRSSPPPPRRGSSPPQQRPSSQPKPPAKLVRRPAMPPSAGSGSRAGSHAGSRASSRPDSALSSGSGPPPPRHILDRTPPGGQTRATSPPQQASLTTPYLGSNTPQGPSQAPEFKPRPLIARTPPEGSPRYDDDAADTPMMQQQVQEYGAVADRARAEMAQVLAADINRPSYARSDPRPRCDADPAGWRQAGSRVSPRQAGFTPTAPLADPAPQTRASSVASSRRYLEAQARSLAPRSGGAGPSGEAAIVETEEWQQLHRTLEANEELIRSAPKPGRHWSDSASPPTRDAEPLITELQRRADLMERIDRAVEGGGRPAGGTRPLTDTAGQQASPPRPGEGSTSWVWSAVEDRLEAHARSPGRSPARSPEQIDATRRRGEGLTGAPESPAVHSRFFERPLSRSMMSLEASGAFAQQGKEPPTPHAGREPVSAEDAAAMRARGVPNVVWPPTSSSVARTTPPPATPLAEPKRPADYPSYAQAEQAVRGSMPASRAELRMHTAQAAIEADARAGARSTSPPVRAAAVGSALLSATSDGKRDQVGYGRWTFEEWRNSGSAGPSPERTASLGGSPSRPPPVAIPSPHPELVGGSGAYAGQRPWLPNSQSPGVFEKGFRADGSAGSWRAYADEEAGRALLGTNGSQRLASSHDPEHMDGWLPGRSLSSHPGLDSQHELTTLGDVGSARCFAACRLCRDTILRCLLPLAIVVAAGMAGLVALHRGWIELPPLPPSPWEDEVAISAAISKASETVDARVSAAVPSLAAPEPTGWWG